MHRDRLLLRFDRSRAWNAVIVFFAIVASALALSAIFAGYIVKAGMPANAPDYFLSTTLVSTLVAIPIAVFGAQYSYRIGHYRASLEAFASTDALTGLLNRLYFEKAAEDERIRMSASNRQGAICVFKLADFKSFNKTYGHDAGDTVLRSVAQIAFAELRGPFDKLARRDGSEFLILLSDLTLEQAISVCERIAHRIKTTHFKLDGERLKVGTNFGVAYFLPESDIDDVIMEADAALEDAESSGPDRVYSSIGAGQRVRLVLANE